MTAVRIRVARVIQETPDAHSIEFDVPAEFADRFTYKPGQFLTIRIPSEQTGSVARCYSLCSAPHEGGRIKVAVKRTRDGYGSNWLCDNAIAGMDVDVLVPAGVFTPKSVDTDLLLFAGGSGITPVMSILKTVLATGSGRVTLIYANRDEKSVIFAAELAELARTHPDRFVVLHWLESVQGLPSVQQLKELATPWRDREAFLCGPAPFMEAGAAALAELGLGRRQINIEKFVSLARNPFEVAASEPVAAEESAASGAPPIALTVELDGDKHELSWPRKQKLLDYLLERGLDAPYSCREGACSACACRITAGEVTLLHNEVLEPEDLEDGIILACQAIAVTDDVTVSYD